MVSALLDNLGIFNQPFTYVKINALFWALHCASLFLWFGAFTCLLGFFFNEQAGQNRRFFPDDQCFYFSSVVKLHDRRKDG